MSPILQNGVNEIADGILTLTLNRPEQRNSLTRFDAGDDPDVRVVVLGANGSAFCAGYVSQFSGGQE